MASTINASNGDTSGLITTGDASGVLQLQVNNGTPAVTLNTAGAVGIGSTPGYGTSGQVLTSGGSSAAPTWGSIIAPSTNGSAGEVLTSNGTATPIWSTPASGPMTLISTTTASGASSVVFTGLSSTYSTYMVLITNSTCTSGYLRLRTSTNNGSSFDSGSGNYNWSLCSTYSGTVSSTPVQDTSYGTGDNTCIDLNYSYVLDKQSWTIYIYSPSAATNTNIGWTGVDSSSVRTVSLQGSGARLNASGAVNAIQFYDVGGGTLTGTYKLYGIT